MTIYTPFQPTGATPPFQFQAQLDGDTYTISVTWSTFGQRWYLTIQDQNNTVILYESLVASPSGQAISNASWEVGIITATTQVPHGYAIGSIINLTISGMTPTAYNGQYQCAITGPSTFTYLLVIDPGSAMVLGTVGYNISLTAGYFDSTLVLREATQTFEVSP